LDIFLTAHVFLSDSVWGLLHQMWEETASPVLSFVILLKLSKAV